MPAIFSDAGLSFMYPENWTIEREEIDSGWLVTLQSPETSFFMFCCRDDCPTAEELAEEALHDLQETYPELEAEPASSAIAGHTAVGNDIRFFLLDLTNTCCTRAFATPNATFLVMWQLNDLELDQYEQVFRAVVASLKFKGP